MTQRQLDWRSVRAIDHRKMEIALGHASELYGTYVEQVARWIRQRAEEERDGR
ncbi:hypothetical protein I4I73_05305 [Pseudonocardia sp. KRD-184]|uniref:Uncharacterized protein n=1 Tax=Pseudonocardia oceani TaxID=2792013 RepID=A0ABS6U6R1_9PSEU|nr:hypothetical protein [Pseudonocardia oceani]MBW0093761.1 hypothetical protein [Pseudonocardia oceani]MBW0095411.1 hypothetical protein [Pseudonocardia oceani]MBW0113146.1 hypothetical protein [Pseudonocardia oceani]MBW0123133.1 hypothetical protein [Pseudonocardia oceani]MBW0127917.1 hypothetical protein [Pseudonocardia oceani]